MADIKKTLSELQALYADNTTAEISPNDLRDGFKTVVGSMYVLSTSSDYTATADDIVFDVNTDGGDITITLPGPNDNDGSGDTFNQKVFYILNTGSNNVVIDGGLSTTVATNKTLSVISNGSDWLELNEVSSGGGSQDLQSVLDVGDTADRSVGVGASNNLSKWDDSYTGFISNKTAVVSLDDGSSTSQLFTTNCYHKTATGWHSDSAGYCTRFIQSTTGAMRFFAFNASSADQSISWTEVFNVSSDGNISEVDGIYLKDLIEIGETGYASKWTTIYSPILSERAAFIGRNDVNESNLLTNTYHDGSFKSIAAGDCTRFVQTSSGQLAFFNYTATAADESITFVERFRINASGELTVAQGGTFGSKIFVERENDTIYRYGQVFQRGDNSGGAGVIYTEGDGSNGVAKFGISTLRDDEKMLEFDLSTLDAKIFYNLDLDGYFRQPITGQTLFSGFSRDSSAGSAFYVNNSSGGDIQSWSNTNLAYGQGIVAQIKNDGSFETDGTITADIPTGTQVGLVGYDSNGKLIQGTGGGSQDLNSVLTEGNSSTLGATFGASVSIDRQNDTQKRYHQYFKRGDGSNESVIIYSQGDGSNGVNKLGFGKSGGDNILEFDTNSLSTKAYGAFETDGTITADIPTGTQEGLVGYDSNGKLIQGSEVAQDLQSVIDQDPISTSYPIFKGDSLTGENLLTRYADNNENSALDVKYDNTNSVFVLRIGDTNPRDIEVRSFNDKILTLATSTGPLPTDSFTAHKIATFEDDVLIKNTSDNGTTQLIGLDASNVVRQANVISHHIQQLNQPTTWVNGGFQSYYGTGSNPSGNIGVGLVQTATKAQLVAGAFGTATANELEIQVADNTGTENIVAVFDDSRMILNTAFQQAVNNTAFNAISRNNDSNPALYVNNAGLGDLQLWQSSTAIGTGEVARIENDGSFETDGTITADIPTGIQEGLVGYDANGKLIQGTGGGSQDLQDVTDIDNHTTNAIIFNHATLPLEVGSIIPSGGNFITSASGNYLIYAGGSGDISLTAPSDIKLVANNIQGYNASFTIRDPLQNNEVATKGYVDALTSATGGGVTPGSWTNASLATNIGVRSGMRPLRYRSDGIDGVQIEGSCKYNAGFFLTAGTTVVLFTLPTGSRPDNDINISVQVGYNGATPQIEAWAAVNSSNGQVTLKNADAVAISELYDITINTRFSLT